MKKCSLYVLALVLAVLAVSPPARASSALSPDIWKWVKIDSVHFPDETFRDYVSANFDSNGDGFLSRDEVPSAKIVSLNASNIESLDGVRYLYFLEELYCADNPDMRYLDISGLEYLEKLDIENDYGLETINVSETKIWELDLTFGLEKLRTVYATDCTSLDRMYINSDKCETRMPLTELSVSGCTSLDTLVCVGTSIVTLDLSNCNKLRILDCSDNKLTSISAASGVKLEYVDCTSNDFSALDFSSSPRLSKLYFAGNRVSALDLSTNPLVYLSGGGFYEGQSIPDQLMIESSANGHKYYYNLKNLVPSAKISKISQVKAYDTSKGYREDVAVFQASSGFVYTDKFPSIIEFKYNTGNAKSFAYDEYSYDYQQFFPVSFKVIDYISSFVAPVISTTRLDQGIVGNTYIAYVETAGSQPLTWSITGGELPKGLSLFPASEQTARIIGIPIKEGDYSFTITASNAGGNSSMTYDVKIRPDPAAAAPSIITAVLPAAKTGLYYGAQLKANGTSPIAWSVAEDSDGLPDGIELSPSGYIKGMLEEAETYEFTVQAQNYGGASTQKLALKVESNIDGMKPVIITSETEPVEVDNEYTFQLMATGTAPITWELTKGKLPEGLTLDSNGMISGTTTKKKTSKITVTATNSYGSASRAIDVSSYKFPEIKTEILNNAILDKNYKMPLTTTGSEPLVWKLEGNLPRGLTFDANKGKFGGKASMAETSTIRVVLSNPVGQSTRVYTLNVDAPKPIISPTKLKDGTVGKKYKVKIKAKGAEPIRLDLEGELPNGITFNRFSGMIEGTPTESCTNRLIRVRASNLGGETEQVYYLTVKGAAPKITTSSLPEAAFGDFYSVQLNATGSAPITWSVSGLPDGLSLTSDGMISGTPNDGGKFSVIVTASNGVKSVSKKLTLKVYSPPILNDGYFSAKLGKTFNETLDYSGTTPMTFSIVGGTLPDGIKLNAKTGVLKGKPRESGDFYFEVQASNSVGTATASYNIVVEE